MFSLASRAHHYCGSLDPSNAQAIKKAQEAEDKEKTKIDVLKSLQKALGQANKKDSTSYTSIPTKLSSLEKKAGAAKIDELMLSMEIKMEKLPREVFVSFLEGALAQVDNAQRLKRTFQKCGLDPYDEDKLLFAQHLESLSKKALYNSLLEAQKSRVYF